jgi:integration host factor subunit beta
MLKSQPVLNVAGRLLQIRRRDVEKAIDAVLDEIVAALARKDRVELRGFGAAFSAKVRAGRIGRNPKTKVKVLVDEKRIPVQAAQFRRSRTGHSSLAIHFSFR